MSRKHLMSDKNFKEFFTKYYLIILGGLIFTLYFWNRFLRSRTSKDLPLDLTVLKFFLTLNICLIFLYIVISLLYPRKQNEFVEQIIKWLFIPIMEFDTFLKNQVFVKSYYEKFLTFIIPKLDFFIIQTNLFFIIFWLLPRLILLIALFIDVFIFHKLHYKYMVILFGLLLFFNRYFKYSLKNTKEQLIQNYTKYISGIVTDYAAGVHPCESEPDYDFEDEDFGPICLPLDIFIKHYVESKVYYNITVDIHSINTTLLLREELWEKYIQQKSPGVFLDPSEIPKDYVNIFGNKVPENYYKAQNLVWDKALDFEKKAVNKITEITLLLEYYNYTNNHDQKIKKIKILIYLNYLICWSYILIISLPTLNLIDLMITINRTWIQIENPFIA